MSQLCPCCSGMPYEKCCKPFHDGTLAENPLQLMRSRYSAYALNIPDYIIKTTHPANSEYSKDVISWKKSIEEFSKSSQFRGLEILKYDPKGATVTFTAYITQDGRDATFTEKSQFEKVGDQWLYLKGIVN